MLIRLPTAWVIALNVAGWPVIQLFLGWAFTRMPERWFNPPAPNRLLWDRRFYERVLRVKAWKDRIPDAARWFRSGFPKGSLRAGSPEYLRRFARETWRGELCHWLALGCAPVFLLWNPWWADVIMVAYALLANVPCILVQRYNRLRLGALLTPKTSWPGRQPPGTVH